MVQSKRTDKTKVLRSDEGFSSSSTRQSHGNWVVFVGCSILAWASLIPLGWISAMLLSEDKVMEATIVCGTGLLALAWNLFHLRRLLYALCQDRTPEKSPMAGRAHWTLVFGVQIITSLICTHFSGASDPFGLRQWFWIPIYAFGGMALRRAAQMTLLLVLVLLVSTAHEQTMHGTLTAMYWVVGQSTSGLFILWCCVAVAVAARQRRTMAARFHSACTRMELLADRASSEGEAQDRTRLTAEIHDHAVDSLTVVSTQLDVMQGLLKNAPERTFEALEKARRAVRTGLTEIRRAVTCKQVAASDEERSLTETMAALLCGAERAGLRLSLQQTGIARPLPTLVENSLYRCVQEGILNSCRHSLVSELSVHVDYTSQTVVSVSVTDNGCDFTQALEQSLRLKRLAQRARLLHGEFAAETGPNGGGLCRMALPC